MPIPVQTDEQRAAAETAANLSPSQIRGVASGVGYTPQYDSSGGARIEVGGGSEAPAPTPVNSVTPAPQPGDDPVVPTPAINRPITPQPGDTQAQTDAAAYLDNFQAPESEDQIVARKTKEAGDRIQASKDYYASLVSDQESANDVNTRETNARSVINGLQGSSAASAAASSAADDNARKLKTDKAQGNVDLQAIYKDIQDSADAELKAQKTDATASAQDILTRKDANRTKAVNDITTLAKSGFDFSAIKASDPVTYQHLADSVGGEDQLNAIAVLNRPQDTILDKSVQGGKYVIAYQNPLTGKVTIQSTDLDLPDGYRQVGDAGDRLLFAPTDWDGDSSKVISVSKGAPPKTDTETQTDKLDAVVQRFASAFTPGDHNGTTTINDKNGTATYEAWTDAINEAPQYGLSRENFIKTFGHFVIDPATGSIDPQYGLTPVEEKLILGTDNSANA